MMSKNESDSILLAYKNYLDSNNLNLDFDIVILKSKVTDDWKLRLSKRMNEYYNEDNWY